MLSSPVKMVASRTSRARSWSTGWRHRTAATVSAPISVAPGRPGRRAGRPGAAAGVQAPMGKEGGLPTYRSSTQLATALGVWPRRHGISEAVVSTPPISTIATTVVIPTTCCRSLRGHQ